MLIEMFMCMNGSVSCFGWLDWLVAVAGWLGLLNWLIRLLVNFIG